VLLPELYDHLFVGPSRRNDGYPMPEPAIAADLVFLRHHHTDEIAIPELQFFDDPPLAFPGIVVALAHRTDEGQDSPRYSLELALESQLEDLVVRAAQGVERVVLVHVRRHLCARPNEKLAPEHVAVGLQTVLAAG